ncbi:MAG: hypothetical protein VB959_09685 [Rhodospirillales bacterium]
MIKSYKSAKTRRAHETGNPKGFKGLDGRRAVRVLDILDAADSIGQLPGLASYRVHKLTGNRQGQWSMTIKLPWVVCFTPDVIEAGKDENGNVISEVTDGWLDVEITDYHKG